MSARPGWAQLSSTAHASARHAGVLVLPIGATEQHGPHLPVGTDALVCEHVARTAAARVDSPDAPIVVAPTLSYGSSHHHLPVPGTLSLSSTTLLAVLTDILSTAAATGYRRVFVLNGHGGNEDIARQAVRDVACELDVVGACAAYWSLAWDELVRTADEHGIATVPGHAGAFETSIAMALWPELVAAAPERDAASTSSRSHPLASVVVEQHRWVHRMGGFSDNPAHASARAGHALLEVVIAACARQLEQFVADHPIAASDR